MSLKRYNPDTVCKPLAAYSQNTEVPAGARWLVTAGQVGITPDGTLLKDRDEQITQTWKNVRAVVEAAGMTCDDIVKLTIFMVADATDMMGHSRAARGEGMGGAAPGATLVYISGLADPDMIIEVDVMAAKVD